MNSGNVLSAALVKNSYINHNVQTMLPIGERRELSEDEQAAIALGKKQWLPKIFDNYKDSPTVNLADPKRQALLIGLASAIPGAIAGAGFSDGNPLGALIGGGITGGIGGTLGYFGRRMGNENIEEVMGRLPEGATQRDFMGSLLGSMLQGVK